MALNRLGLLRPALSQAFATRLRPVLGAGAGSCIPHALQNGSLEKPKGYPSPQVRFYATKKSKAKAKGQASKVSMNTALGEDIISLEEVKGDMANVLEILKDEFSRSLNIRTSPGALDHINVTTKDGKFPLNQLGQISMKSPQLIVVNMTGFPEATAAATSALRESSMKLNPEVEGSIIRVPIPMVTREHRENLAKLAKQFSNKSKDSLRRVRSGAHSQLKKAKEGVSEDTVRIIEKQIQQMMDTYAADVDKQLALKTKELLG
ncbi:ribosome-recycling factor, mitochondrial [Clupea harengus]|uniref:Ribosome-recycling factor, mitochondrial n=1 Tax=Clupea harengus TaxID=7950 RepID=A0A6P3VPG2_CLUHA|nr:ribosome-recycling factor, mitochondrial [Clupea harengus]